METDYGVMEGADALDRLTLFGVVVPTATGFESVDLDLRRVDPVADNAEVWINGEYAGDANMLRQDVTSWAGTIVGDSDTDVALSITPTGAYGWIYQKGEYAHITPAPVGGDDWTAGRSLIIHASDPLMSDGPPDFVCEGAILTPGYVEPDLPGVQHTYSGTTRECFIAVETDTQLYNRFGNSLAEMNYIVALWATISDRYESQTNTTISLPYLGLYTQGTDPWTAQGSGSGAMLDQFRGAWAFNIPMNANLAHFMSGANLGGGVAYLDVLCNGNFGFAVSGNLAGNTPTPVIGPHPLNWDFTVTAHETGHNFGSPHTHSYCPPLDQCYPGNCSSGNGCGTGTIMSYCHLCPGGMNNIQPNFHPTAASVMTSDAANSCLGACQSCNGTLNADFTADVTVGGGPLTVNFTDLSTGGTITSRTWSFGDGTTSNATNPTHVYTDPGNYPVSLVISGSGTFDAEHRGAYITVNITTAISTITPSSVPSLIPGSEETITVNGTSFVPSTTLEIDGSPITTSYTVVNQSTIRFDMPQLPLGAHTLTVANANGTDTEGFSIVAPAEPVLMLGDGEGVHQIFSTTGMDVTAAGQPFGLQLVIASPSNLPSTLPGKFDLLIGNFFTQDYNLGPLFLDVNGIGTTNIPMVGIVNLTIYVQTLQVNLPTPAGFPWPDSNVAEGFIWF